MFKFINKNTSIIVDYYRKHVFKRQIENQIWLNIKNFKTRKFFKKFFNKNENFFVIIKIINFHVYEFKLFDNWKCHFVFDIHLLHDKFHDSLSNQRFFALLFVVRDKHDNELWKIIRINNFEISTKRLQYFVIWKNDTKNWISIRNCRNVFEFIIEYVKNWNQKLHHN